VDRAERHAIEALRIARRENDPLAILRAEILRRRIRERVGRAADGAPGEERIRKLQARASKALAEREPLGLIYRDTGKHRRAETLFSLSRPTHVHPGELLERIETKVAATAGTVEPRFDELLAEIKKRFYAADYQAMLDLCDDAEKQLFRESSEEDARRREFRAELYLQRSMALRGRSELKRSEEATKRAIQLSQGMALMQTRAYLLLNTIQVASGLLALAEISAKRALELSESCGAHWHGLAWLQKGNCLYAERRLEEARRTYMRGLEFCREAKDDNHCGILEGNIGTCLQDLGRRKQARKRFEKAVALARKCGNHNFEAFWLIALGHFHLDGGDLDEAERCATAALRIARRRDRVLLVFRGEWLRHLVVQRRRPGARDTRRLNRLRELYPRVRQEVSDDAVREYGAMAQEPREPFTAS
jgi:tetratricopeptide (TPR) repeat protein